MDYGQTSQTDANTVDFFTAGAGTQNELANNVEPENNFDLSNDAASWNPTNSRFKNRNFGHNAIRGEMIQAPAANTSEAATNLGLPHEKAGPDFGAPAPEFGRITDLEQPASKTENSLASGFEYDGSAIRIEGDTLSKKAAEIFAKNEKSLSKTGDAAAYVDVFEQAKIDNLKNSYNREFGGQ